jgi:hypothetical protein
MLHWWQGVQNGVQTAIDSFLGQHGGPALREPAIAEYVQVRHRLAPRNQLQCNAMASALAFVGRAVTLVTATDMSSSTRGRDYWQTRMLRMRPAPLSSWMMCMASTVPRSRVPMLKRCKQYRFKAQIRALECHCKNQHLKLRRKVSL